LACCLLGCFLAAVVVIIAVVVATVAYGDFDRVLEKPPETRSFMYGCFGYFGAEIAALVAGIFAGLLRIGSTPDKFKSSIWRKVLPSGGIGALLGLATGLGVAHWNWHGRSDAAITARADTDLYTVISFSLAAGIIAVVFVKIIIVCWQQRQRRLRGRESY
jgi:hypothetical protein